jgi:DNA replication protein DnaC
METIGEILQPMQQKVAAARGFEMEWITCPVCKSPKESLKTAHFTYANGSEKTICNECENKLKSYETFIRDQELKAEARQQFFNDNSMINHDLKDATFENFDAETMTQKIAREEAKLLITKLESIGLENSNLLLTGQYGIGKSHIGAAACKTAMTKGLSALFIDVPTLLTEIKSTFNKNATHTEKDVLKWIKEVDLLVLDDIGSTSGSLDDTASKFEAEKLFQITNSRQGKATIYTTNMTGEQLKNHVGDRVFSRILNKTVPVTVDGRNRRTFLQQQKGYGF